MLYLLIALVVVVIIFDFMVYRNTKIDSDTKAVINLKKGLRPDILIFIALMLYTIIHGYLYQTYSITTISFAIVLVLLVIKVTYINPKRIIVTDKLLKLSVGVLPLAAVKLFTINEEAKLVIQIEGTNKVLSFKPRDPADYETVLYCVEELNVGNSQEIIVQHRLAQIAARARGVFPLVGVIKDYDWGGNSYIPDLIGLKHQKAAELWLGTHPAGLGIVEMDGQAIVDLAKQFYKKKPEQSRIDIDAKEAYYILLNFNLAYGQPLRKTDTVASDALPWLFKILDVARPLSIQIHPDKETAERGFENENKLKIKLDDPMRTFKDTNAKPELMVALTDFYLLHGFNTKQAILEQLADKPLLAKFRELVAAQELKELYSNIMTMNYTDLRELFGDHLRTCLELYGTLIEKQLEAEDINQHLVVDGNDSSVAALDPDYWFAFTFRSLDLSEHKLDPGLACFYLFNLVKLEKYQGIFQAANVPHAYLRGRNFEVMAQSDNVIRGGLTHKYVNKTLLLEFTDCNPVTPHIYAKDQYDIPVTDFNAHVLTLSGEQELYCENASIYYFIDGAGTLTFNDHNGHVRHTKVSRGKSFFVTADQKVTFTGEAELIVTSC